MDAQRFAVAAAHSSIGKAFEPNSDFKKKPHLVGAARRPLQALVRRPLIRSDRKRLVQTEAIVMHHVDTDMALRLTLV